jgi:hypothetical protein
VPTVVVSGSNLSRHVDLHDDDELYTGSILWK